MARRRAGQKVRRLRVERAKDCNARSSMDSVAMLGWDEGGTSGEEESRIFLELLFGGRTASRLSAS